MAQIEPIESDDQLCQAFKAVMTKTKMDYGREITIDISYLEKFFRYSAENLKTSFVPKRIRDNLTKIGVALRKNRGRTTVNVILK